ncbi:DDE-type integrase/transposase/recombinase [Cryobacterium sp. PH31-O1]|uniref:DDE-type integrase/transposase/recombinase n=1 Tax=Cryobacterium sp. PH31-O1 TaxID=3046306 RepID=UPI0024BB1A39|nr:DDE-type integrase/transposase/recombinase [Cryobacterium sp. PH31-O1]MDJ0337581.1 DDE-type integrase/transposase/recombinase [Cryobacterium sp. PH31-O1]
MSVNERWLEILLTPQRDGISVAAACRRYGISRQSFYEYRRRLWSEGVPALQPRSTRPTTSPSRTASEIESLIVKLRVDNPRWGARTLHTKLVQAGLARPPVVSTIHRVLQRHGLVVAQEHRAPKEWKRFERHAPNDLWQIDGTMVALADGSKAWIVDLLDDHARYAIGATAVRRFTVHAAWKAMDTAITEHGVPRQLISDNGLQFKSRKGQKPVFFQERLAALNIHLPTPTPADLREARALPPHLQRVLCRQRPRRHDRGIASTVRPIPLVLQPRTTTPRPQPTDARSRLRRIAEDDPQRRAPRRKHRTTRPDCLRQRFDQIPQAADQRRDAAVGSESPRHRSEKLRHRAPRPRRTTTP